MVFSGQNIELNYGDNKYFEKSIKFIPSKWSDLFSINYLQNSWIFYSGSSIYYSNFKKTANSFKLMVNALA